MSENRPDPDALLDELRAAAGPAPLPPLHLSAPTPSARPGVRGAAVTRIRSATLRLLTPVLGDLLGQLERDRARTRAEIADLSARVAALEDRHRSAD